VKNEGNTEMTILLDADVSEQGWTAEIEGPSGSTFIQLGAYEELSFNLKVFVPSDANNGDKVPVLVTAMPLAYVIDGTLDTSQSWSDEYTAKKTVIMTVDLGNVIDIVINEISHPRPLTIIVLVVGFLLIIAGFQSSMNRRRWASHMALIESMNREDDEDDEEDDSELESEELTPVIEQSPDPNRYDDDDIELV
jgi:F0F1-type ATP synthase assembly protein I